MEIHPMSAGDVARLAEIDGTIESAQYLHLTREGDGLLMACRLEQRPLRTKLIDSNRPDDEVLFAARQITQGVEEGLALVAEHEGQVVAALTAMPRVWNRTLRVLDLRVDYDYRRQGLGQAMIYQAIQRARDLELRAVAMRTRTNNVPAAQFLHRAGFALAGLDMQHHTNHDLVEDAVALFWYAALD